MWKWAIIGFAVGWFVHSLWVKFLIRTAISKGIIHVPLPGK